VLGSSGFLDSDSMLERRKVAQERELIPGTKSSYGSLRGLNIHESTRMDAQERVKYPISMYSVHGSMEVTANASSVVGAEVSSSEGVATTMDGMMDLETDSSGGTRITSLAKREC
jgi:hypothetical protein